MLAGFAHEAVLMMDVAADHCAPGAAITVALCGHWRHDGPCPLAPHHTRAERDGEVVRLRTLFAAAPEQEADIRQRIDQALAAGTLAGAATLRAGTLSGRHGVTARWRLLSSGPDTLRADEAEHAQRLARS